MTACQMKFKKELDVYEAHKGELSSQVGKYVLICEDELVGVWDTYADALQVAYEKFGLDRPFMVKKIEGLDGIKYFTRDISCPASQPPSCPTGQ